MRDTDLELLASYAQHRTEDAFAEIVRRHLGLVYSAALRQVRSPHLAEEVAQSVFTTLARDAGRLRSDTILTAWLYQVAHHTAANLVRGEVRRQKREQIASEMHATNAPDADWTHIEPLLEEAMHTLNNTDRAAVLLRYFENKSLREVGQALSASENAAQKRLTRAIEQLREFFVHRGVTVGASGFAALVSANAAQAAPVGLAVTISTAALTATAVQASITSVATQTIVMTALQRTLASVVLVAALGTAVYQARQASRWRDQAQMLQLQQATTAEQMERLRSDRDDATNRLARLNVPVDILKGDTAELLRLRGETGVLRAQLSTLEADHRKLAAESIPGRLRSRTDWSDQGNETPFATVETMLWATSLAQASRLTEVATPEAIAEARWPIFPSEQPPIQTVGAVNLISSSQNQEGTRAVVTAFVREDFMAPPGGMPYSVNKLRGWRLTKSDVGWRISKVLFFDLGSD